MKLCFELSMPGCPSWDGKWSGAESLYAVIKNFKTQKDKNKALEILNKGYYSYSWSDGWRASISVKEVDNLTARKITKKSKGFCGYEWMVKSILENGLIKS